MKKTMWLMPIRYWEDSAPIRFDLIVNETCPLTGLPHGENYGFHHGYGHNAYVQKADLFKTKRAAIKESRRRTKARKIQLEEECKKVFEKILAALKKKK